jgi:hypothetical protein
MSDPKRRPDPDFVNPDDCGVGHSADGGVIALGMVLRGVRKHS